ncbi:hypothetical protein TI05_00660 [Achromatium sp. WMS3]|nr:hypothetical protein TI05_00660 [Achromatium sp. WMS3]
MQVPLLVVCSCPDQSTGIKIAEALVTANVAACVTVQGSTATSVYRWNDKIEHATEAILLIKTTERRYPELEHLIQNLHPYQVPEIIALPITMGLNDYLSWVEKCTNSTN